MNLKPVGSIAIQRRGHTDLRAFADPGVRVAHRLRDGRHTDAGLEEQSPVGTSKRVQRYRRNAGDRRACCHPENDSGRHG